MGLPSLGRYDAQLGHSGADEALDCCSPINAWYLLCLQTMGDLSVSCMVFPFLDRRKFDWCSQYVIGTFIMFRVDERQSATPPSHELYFMARWCRISPFIQASLHSCFHFSWVECGIRAFSSVQNVRQMHRRYTNLSCHFHCFDQSNAKGYLSIFCVVYTMFKGTRSLKAS